MRLFLIGGCAAAIALAVLPATAADIARPAPPAYKTPAPVVAAFSWHGCYVGGHIGGIKNDSRVSAQPGATYLPDAVAAGTYHYDLDDTALKAGVQYGCNMQFGSWVLGLDSSFSWSGLKDSVSATHPPVAPLPAYSETITQELRWLSTTRVRVGYAWDRWMIYVQGGLASGRIESTYFSPPAAGVSYAGTIGQYRYGWAAGAGLETALSENWFLRAEYLYIDLGDFSYTAFQTPAGASSWHANVDTRFHVARVGLSYRFTRAGSMLEWAVGGFR